MLRSEVCSFACLSRTCILISTFSDWILNVGMMIVSYCSSHQQFSRNPQIFHVRSDFLLGLPTITSILRRISVVRSSNTNNFSDTYFFSLFINYGSFGRKVSKGNSLSCLVLLQEHFSEKWYIHFFHFFRTFLSVLGVFEAVLTLQRACYD